MSKRVLVRRLGWGNSQMRWPTFSVDAAAVANFKSATQTSIVVFISYLVGAEAAFLVGTLSDNIFAPFWPPNVVLLASMLLVGRERIWLCIFSAFPAHVIAETWIGMPPSQIMPAFAANVTVAAASAVLIWKVLGKPPWFATFRDMVLYVVLVGFVSPAAVAFGGAFASMPVGRLATYSTIWLQWFLSNVLGNLALGTIALILVTEGITAFWPRKRSRQIEVIALICAIVAVTHIVFARGAGSASIFLPSLLYAPLPIIIWYAARFGVAGASLSILAVTFDLIWRALNGPSLFLGATPETSVFALQIFLICLSVPVLLLGASIDQTRKIERQLREDEERIALAAAAANVGFWQYDATLNRLWLSDYARLLFALPENRLIALSDLLAMVHPDSIESARQIVSGKGGAEGNKSTELRTDGSENAKWILARSQSQNTSPESTTSGIFIDVTARKVAEAEAEEHHRELAHMMRVSQIGELSGGLAHEIAQPLTAILANAQAARLLLKSPRADLSLVAEVLDDIIQEDHRAGEVIKHIRSLLKNSNAAVESVEISRLVNSTLLLLRSELINRDVRIETDLSLRPLVTRGDAVQLQQVFINLVMNAVEAVHQLEVSRRVIVIRSRYGDDNMIEVRVEDRGAGFNALDQKRIFEPFFTTKERGLGLGLSICSTIIRNHNGMLRLENNPEEGATAYVRLLLEQDKMQYEL